MISSFKIALITHSTTSARFRKQLDGFLAEDDAKVEIEEGMMSESYLLLVILLPLFLPA